MHNNFIDKDRRYISLRQAEVKGVLPEYFRQSFPQFITLLEKYYDWQESEPLTGSLDNPAELLHHIFASRDITETDITLLSFIEDELLLGDAYFEGFGQTEAELRAAANFSNILFRSKGTKFAIEWFFRSFYGVDAEVVYPKEDIFTIGDTDTQIGPASNKFITNDGLYQTWSLLLNTSIPISKWREIFKLFAHPAGMYLAGNVTLNGDYDATLTPVGLDSAITARTTPTYALGVTPNTVADEGSIFTFNLSANNLPNDGGVAYFYVDDTGTATDSDFLVPVPDSASPQIFPINGGTGTFTVTTIRDSDETEGAETFTVRVLDDEFRNIGFSTITLNDVVSQYTLSVDNTTKNEGETFNFTVTGTTGTTPSGDHLLQYYVTHGTTTDADFVGIVPSAVSPASVNISNDSGQFSLQTRIDGVTPEANESFTVTIRTPQNVVKDTLTGLEIVDVPPTFSLTAPTSVVEGDSDILISLTTDPTTVGTTVNWSIDSDLNGRLPITSGSFTITNTNMSNVFLTSTNATDSAEDLTKSLALINLTTTGGVYTPELTTSAVTQVNNETPVYSIDTNPASAQEGDTVDIVVTTTNAAAGTYYYFIENINTTNADFSVTPPLSGTRQSFSHGGGTQTTTISNAFTYTVGSDPDEDYRLFLSDQGPSGGGVLTNKIVTIGDANITYALSSSSNTPNEGDTVTMTFTTTPATTGNYYYYVAGTGITSDDFTSGFATSGSRGTVAVTSGTGTFDLVLAEDAFTEGAETVSVFISKTTTGGTVAADTFEIQDTSTSVSNYPVSVTSAAGAGIAREGIPFDVSIGSGVTVTDTPLYIEITGISSGRLPSPQFVRVVTSSELSQSALTGAPIITTFSTVTSNDYQGDVAGMIAVGINNYVSSGGSQVGSTTFNFVDESPLYTLTSNVSSGNEGDTITFTFDGTNVPSGNYTHHNDAIKGKLLASAIGGGDTRIFLNNTTGLQIGMRSFSGLTTGVEGSITNVGTTFVDMDTAVPFIDVTYGSVGEKIYFGFQADRDDTTELVTPFTMATGTPETEVFTVTFDEDNDAGSETITWGVYDENETLLVSKSVDITDTSSQVTLPAGDYGFLRSVDLPLVRNEIEFRPDGQVYISDPISVSTALVNSGFDWIDDPANPSFDASNFEIQATQTFNLNNGSSTGQLGVWSSLASNQSWSVTVFNPGGQNRRTLVFQIREVGNVSNSDTWESVFLIAEELYTPGQGGNLE